MVKFAPGKDWPWIKAIGYAVRITQHADGTESDEVRHYLSSRYLSGKRFGAASVRVAVAWVEGLLPFAAVCVMQERTPLPRDIIGRLLGAPVAEGSTSATTWRT